MNKHLPLAFILLTLAGCDDNKTAAPPPAASSVAASASSSAKPLPPLELVTFEGLGLTFQYPKPYVADTATSNPEIHQVAVDHGKEPGVLTIRFNPKDPDEDVKLAEVAEATRQRMGPEATVEPTKLKVAGKEYEARVVKSKQMGLVNASDVVAIVELGGTNYIVLTHVADDERERAQRMFDTVLGSLARK